MARFVRLLFAAIVVLGAGSCAPMPAQQTASPPAGFPTNLRWDLVPRWIQWSAPNATISWPPNDGCAAPPAAETLPPGALIDRFGSEGGSFFSPKGESFADRAVPYVCRQMDYRVYRVVKPMPVKACHAAPWFGEPGGATQVQTTDPAYKMVASGTIETVTYAGGGSDGPAPQCGTP